MLIGILWMLMITQKLRIGLLNSLTNNRITKYPLSYKSVKVSSRKLARKPWITVGLLKSIRTKDKLYKKKL